MTFTKKECDEIISWQYKFPMTSVLVSPAAHPAGLKKSKLEYGISQVDRVPETQWAFDKISEYLRPEYPNNNVNERGFFYLHKFEEGHYFSKHIDRDRQNDWALVVGGILNDDFEGGKLITYNPDGELATRMGEVYKMDVNILHEVTQITKGIRYSFVFFVEHQYLGVDKAII